MLYTWFTERGFPRTLVSDNGPQFTAKEFADKMSKWGVKHILTPPYHPASNGAAEKAFGIVKAGYEKILEHASMLACKLEGCMQLYHLWLVESFKTKKKSTF